MTTRREPTTRRDDAPLRVVAHRLHKVDAAVRAQSGGVASPPAKPNGHQAAARHAEASPSIRRQVVLVDRDIDALRDVAVALRDEFDFHITISGAEALALLRAGNIDAIVVGQTLYSSTGLNVLSEARRHAPHTQRILLASAAEALAAQGATGNVSPFRIMQRPCTADKLRDALMIDAAAAESQHAHEKSPIELLDDPVDPPRSAAPAPDPEEYEHVVLETAPEPPRRTSRSNYKDAADAPVRVVVFTDDAEFYRSIAVALQDRYDVQLCTQFDRLAEMAEMGQCPILITDRAGTQVELQRITIALRALNSNVTTIAAGPEYVGTALRRLLGTGSLHSFLPTPVSAPLVRLMVDSAKRQYLEAKEQRHPVPELKPAETARQSLRSRYGAAPTPAYVPGYMNDFSADTRDESRWRRAAPAIAIAAAISIALAAGGWFAWQTWQKSPEADTQHQVQPTAASAEVERALELAAQAYAAGRYATPVNDSAAYYYSQALQREPGNSVARAGLNQSLERVLEQAEQALIDERIDNAAAALAAVRAVQPDNKRLPFLEVQLDRQRRQSETRSQPAPAARATPPREPAPEAAVAPINNERQRQQSVARWLNTARQRLAQGRLTSPENDSAEYYFGLAERADPGNAAARQGYREIGVRLMALAREALSRQQANSAKQYATDALRFGADRSVVDQLIADADASIASGSRASLLRLVQERTRDNRLFEPERDSARHYLSQLQQLDANAVETQAALRTIALKLIENADTAIGQRQLNTASQLLNEARRLGYAGPELTAADERLRIARNPPPPPAPARDVVATPPKVIKTVQPRFPEDAVRAGVEGWVDVSFRITAAGDVADATAVASNPPGPYAAQFERSAVAAIRQYKFEPRPLDDRQTTQRMVVRVQFKMQ